MATLVMHPLDLVKVRFQLAETPIQSSAAPHSAPAAPASSISQNPVASSSRSSLSSVLDRRKPRLGTGVYRALEDAVRADGWKGLYRGLVPNLVGGASSWGLYFLL